MNKRPHSKVVFMQLIFVILSNASWSMRLHWNRRSYLCVETLDRLRRRRSRSRLLRRLHRLPELPVATAAVEWSRRRRPLQSPSSENWGKDVKSQILIFLGFIKITSKYIENQFRSGHY